MADSENPYGWTSQPPKTVAQLREEHNQQREALGMQPITLSEFLSYHEAMVQKPSGFFPEKQVKYIPPSELYSGKIPFEMPPFVTMTTTPKDTSVPGEDYEDDFADDIPSHEYKKLKDERCTSTAVISLWNRLHSSQIKKTPFLFIGGPLDGTRQKVTGAHRDWVQINTPSPSNDKLWKYRLVALDTNTPKKETYLFICVHLSVANHNIIPRLATNYIAPEQMDTSKEEE